MWVSIPGSEKGEMMIEKVMVGGKSVPIKGLGLGNYWEAMAKMPRRGTIGEEYQESGYVIDNDTIVARFESGQQGCSGCKLTADWATRDRCVQALGIGWNGLCAYR